MAYGHGPIRGKAGPTAPSIRDYATLQQLVLRCEKMLKCVHDYFVYLK